MTPSSLRVSVVGLWEQVLPHLIGSRRAVDSTMSDGTLVRRASGGAFCHSGVSKRVPYGRAPTEGADSHRARREWLPWE
jgi:hypothetical protein